MWHIILANLMLIHAAAVGSTATSSSNDLTVKTVNAVCTEDGITARIEFSRAFCGKIYSSKYPNIPDCVYHNKTDSPIVDLIENRVYVQLDKDAQTSQDHQFLFTCQLAPQPKDSNVQNDQMQPGSAEQNYLWNKMVPNFGSSNNFNPVMDSDQLWDLRPGSDSDRYNNWGNWPIQPITTPDAETVPLPEINIFANSEEKFENWPLEMSTTEDDKTAATDITAATATATPEFNSISQDISSRVLEETKFWRNEIFVPSFTKKTAHESFTDTTTAAAPAEVTMSTITSKTMKFANVRTRINTTIGWTEPLDPIRVFATQLPDQKPNSNTVYMEIQHADRVPFGNTINRPIRIGENISLVVRTKSHGSEGGAYKIFVHSCHASDGPGTTKIMLIDRFGCAVRPRLTGPMTRMEDSGQIYYYFRISAFKFPGPDDVYFSCAVDIGGQNASLPEICTVPKNTSRRRRNFDGYGVKHIELHENAVVLNSKLYRKSEPRKNVTTTVCSIAATRKKLHVSIAANVFLALITVCLMFITCRLRNPKPY